MSKCISRPHLERLTQKPRKGVQCLINWIWLANKTPPSVPEGAFGGQGPSPRSRQTALIPCFPQNTNGWNLYFSYVNFPLQRCHLQDRPQRAQREREDVSCIISCSSKLCRSDLVGDTPSWFSVPVPGAFIHDSVSLSVSPSYFYLFHAMFIALFSYHIAMVSSWQQGGTGGTLWPERGLFATPSLQAKCQMPPLHSFLTTWSRGSVFCCSWTALSKSLSFTLSVCAARLTKTHTAFFQPEVLVLAPSPVPLAPPLCTHTTLTNPLT